VGPPGRGWSRQAEENDVSTLAWIIAGGIAAAAHEVPQELGASDLVPEVNRHHDPRVGATHFLAFVAGAGLLAALKLVLGA
jgi:hypothetical protein